jgi:peptidoglycan/xylan/chitin deacetylase (PgdA/CDA1 family)
LRNDQCVNIVTYHSVSPRRSVLTDHSLLRHTPAEFERQIDYLAENYSPIRLRDLVAALERGDPPRRAVVITFDDGFADTVRVALPILYRRRIPAAVFPVTSVIGNRDLMWQHKLAWLLSAGHGERVAEAMAAEGLGRAEPGEKVAALARRCYGPRMPNLLEEVVRSTGRSGRDLAGELRPYLEPEEMAGAEPDLVEFGNHTHTHAILSALSPEAQREEISLGAKAVRAVTGQAPVALAYPFGLKRHYDEHSTAIARETGHRAALDLRRRLNAGRVSPFELSRKPAPAGSQLLFEQMMEDWPQAPAAAPAEGVG